MKSRPYFWWTFLGVVVDAFYIGGFIWAVQGKHYIFRELFDNYSYGLEDVLKQMFPNTLTAAQTLAVNSSQRILGNLSVALSDFHFLE